MGYICDLLQEMRRGVEGQLKKDERRMEKMKKQRKWDPSSSDRAGLCRG